MNIGILGIQGAIVEHEKQLLEAANKLNFSITITRILNPKDMDTVDGLVMPGGESTAMRLIGNKNGMLSAVQTKLNNGLPAFGTCAGAILLAKSVKRNLDSTQSEGAFPMLNIEILRNGYGRQKDSFSTELNLNDGSAMKGIFIRAPIISKIGDDVEIISSFDNHPVIVKEQNIIASTCHPELTTDTIIHEKFLKLVSSNIESNSIN